MDRDSVVDECIRKILLFNVFFIKENVVIYFVGNVDTFNRKLGK